MTDKEFYALTQKYASIMNPFTALCQCNWETRTGGKPWNSELYHKANNCAGLKSWKGWSGASYEKVSWEQNADGTKVDRKSSFCKYPTLDDFLINYASKMKVNYPRVLARKENFWGCFDGLLTGTFKWATDRTYFTRLCNVAVELAPETFGPAWQDKLFSAYEYAVSKNYLSKENQQDLEKILTKLRPLKISPKPGTGTPVPDLSKKKHVIVIDPGHGEPDSGAPGLLANEADINLSISWKVLNELNRRGYIVRLTRTGRARLVKLNKNKDLEARAQLANDLRAILLSVHCNSFTDPRVHGFEVYTTKGQDHSDPLATAIFNAWRTMFPSQKLRTDYSDNDPDKEANFKVLAKCLQPACLIECGFIKNPEEEKWLLDTKNQENMAIAIANGIDQFLKG